ncbi:MAG: DUF2577 domain-containing protein [Alkaliphilus sp.]
MIQLIKKAAAEAIAEAEPTAFLFGAVVSENPLKIKIDQRFTLGEKLLTLTDSVRDYKTIFSFDNPNIINKFQGSGTIGVNTHEVNLDMAVKTTAVKNEITIYNGLKIGEKVLLAKIQGGQKYIVLNRVVSA